MEEEKKSFIKNNYPEEVDIIGLVHKLWNRRKFIIIISFVFLLIGLFIAFTSPVQFTSTCSVVPQTGRSSSSSGIGSVASIMGINLGTAIMSEGTLSPNMYSEIVKSVPFTRELMKTEIVVEKSNGKQITLYDFYSDKSYQNFNLIGVIKKYTIGLPNLVIRSLRSNKSPGVSSVNTTQSDSTSSVFTLNAAERSVYNAIQSSISIQPNSRTGLVTISYTFPEPNAAAIVTDQIYKILEEYIGRFRSEKVNDNLEFVEQSYLLAQIDFNEAQNRLASFQDANRGLTTATARSTQIRLQNEYDVAFTIFRELATQREQAKLAVRENQTILTMVNPPVVPFSKSAPRRSLIIIGSFLIGAVLSSLWVLVSPFFKSLGKQID